jgi:hypothetical protein
MPARKRKLFLAHAGELAHRLSRTLADSSAVGGDSASAAALVETFLRSYAARHDRSGLLRDAARLREMRSTIGREALFVMAVEVERLIPAAFAARPRAVLRPDEAALADAFRTEFLASLARAQDWPPADVAADRSAFDRDLEMYRDWRLRGGSRAAASSAVESPFADRCALLLDPSMMEQARRAASAFESELLRHGAQLFARLGRPESAGSRGPRPRIRRTRPTHPAPRHARRRARRPAKRRPRRSPRRKTKRRPASRRKR